MRPRRGLALSTCVVLGALSLVVPSKGAVCTVPGTHATIQAAVDEPSCTTIELASQTYLESVEIYRSVAISGPPGGVAIMEGQILIWGASAEVSLTDVSVLSGCLDYAMSVQEGARLAPTEVEVQFSATAGCPTLASIIFTDGFESGDTSAWSSTVP